MRIAGLQTAGTPGRVDANLTELGQAVVRARQDNVQLLVTSELFVTGYDIGESLRDLARFDPLPAIRAMASAHGVAILVGYAEHTEHGLYNAATLIDAEGHTRLHYRKQHLFGALDRAFFLPGSAPPEVITYQGIRLATMICYDVEFPEYVRATALAGCELLLVPTAQMEPFTFVAREVIRARAWENQIYIAYINHDGQEGQTRYVGNSQIVAPDASVLARIEQGTGLITADVSAQVVTRAQHANPYLQDRRPASYQSLVAVFEKDTP